MKPIKLIILSILLTGCADINKKEDIDLAVKFCSDKDGLENLYKSTIDNTTQVTCSNGSEIKLTPNVKAVMK